MDKLGSYMDHRFIIIPIQMRFNADKAMKRPPWRRLTKVLMAIGRWNKAEIFEKHIM
jgi:hypothetical protein